MMLRLPRGLVLLAVALSNAVASDTAAQSVAEVFARVMG